MKKIIAIIMTLATLALFMTGCSNSKSTSFDDNAVKEVAQSAITMINNGEYEKFTTDLVREDVQSGFTVEVISNAVQQVMPDAGDFVEFFSDSISTQKDKNGNEYAVMVIGARYENQDVVYTVSIDKDLKVIGLFMK